MRKSQIVSQPILELQTDQIKKHLLLSEDTLEGKQNTAVMCLTEAQDAFLIKMTQDKKKHTLFAFDFKPTYMIAPESVAS